MQSTIERQSVQLRALREALLESAKRRADELKAKEAWSHACTEFAERYDELAFPGGLQVGLGKIAAGDLCCVETAILYLELRPFYYRAQFVRNEFRKRLKKLSLPPRLQKRFDAIQTKLRTWRAEKASALRAQSERLHALSQSRIQQKANLND